MTYSNSDINNQPKAGREERYEFQNEARFEDQRLPVKAVPFPNNTQQQNNNNKQNQSQNPNHSNNNQLQPNTQNRPYYQEQTPVKPILHTPPNTQQPIQNIIFFHPSAFSNSPSSELKSLHQHLKSTHNHFQRPPLYNDVQNLSNSHNASHPNLPQSPLREIWVWRAAAAHQLQLARKVLFGFEQETREERITRSFEIISQEVQNSEKFMTNRQSAKEFNTWGKVADRFAPEGLCVMAVLWILEGARAILVKARHRLFSQDPGFWNSMLIHYQSTLLNFVIIQLTGLTIRVTLLSC